MKPFLRNFLLKIAELIGKARGYIKTKLKISYKPFLACMFAFILVFFGVYVTASRNIAIKQIKKHINQTINYLNELGLDVSYDNIEFNSMMFYPLVKIDNLKLYSTTSLNDWAIKFQTIKAYPNIIGTKKIRFKSTGNGTFKFNEFVSEMDSDETFVDIEYNNENFKELVFHAEDFKIKDLAII